MKFFNQACTKLSIPPPPVGGRGIKSKGLEMGKKIKSLKKRKKKIFEDSALLVVPKGSGVGQGNGQGRQAPICVRLSTVSNSLFNYITVSTSR